MGRQIHKKIMQKDKYVQNREMAQGKTQLRSPGLHSQTVQDSSLGSATSQLCDVGSDLTSVGLSENNVVPTP